MMNRTSALAHEPVGMETAQGMVPDDAPRPGWGTMLIVLVSYAAAVAVATYPRVTALAKSLPGPVDPIQHLWVMRWYRSCFLEGRLPLFCPEIQYPEGAALGLFSPMLLQGLLFFPLSLVISNDILCYNILWYGSFLFTGFSVFLLVWYVLRDRVCAGFAGLLAMLSTPMMLRAHGHLELMSVGSICLFLIAWMRFVDRPTRGRLATAAVLYWVVAACAAYFAPFATIPAVLYVLSTALRSERGAWGWLRGRLGWLTGFSVAVLPGLLLLFASQLWAVFHGIDLDRPSSEFERYGSAPWSYLVPTISHPLHAAFPFDVYTQAGYSMESMAYLGVVGLLLLLIAAVRCVPFPRARYWWSLLGLLVVLSMGAYWQLGSHRIPLPAKWLREFVPIFQTIRSPARFNLLACCVAAVIAAAGLRELLSATSRRWARAVVVTMLGLVVVADMSMTPFPEFRLPAMPAGYAWIRERNPEAVVLDAPLIESGAPDVLTATCAYWQTHHGLRTTAGYSGFSNRDLDARLLNDSPMSVLSLLNPEHLADPDHLRVGSAAPMTLREYAWMVLQTHNIDFIVYHKWTDFLPYSMPQVARLQGLLANAKVYEDDACVIYDRRRLERPTRAVVLCDEGWKRWPWPDVVPTGIVEQVGTVTVFVPDDAQPIRLSVIAQALGGARTVQVRDGQTLLARWEVGSDVWRPYDSPPLRLTPGMHHLTIETDHAEDSRYREENRFRLRVAEVGAVSEVPADALLATPGTDSRRE